jgi:Protein of unknown function (DUF3667).
MDRCVSCGTPLTGNFCAYCGERRPDRNHFRFSRFLRRALEEITDFEHSKLLKTIRLLLVAPGKLTTEYLRGSVRPYVGPIKLYLSFFALTLFLYSIYQPAAIYDINLFLSQDTTQAWHQVVTTIAQKRHITESQVIFETNTRWQRYLYLSEIIYPLVLGLFLSLVYRGQRRYYAEHLVFALAFLSFAYLIQVLFWPVYAIVGVKFSAAYFLVSVPVLLGSAIYLLLALRRVYEESWIRTGLKSTLLYLFYFFLNGAVAVISLILAIKMTLHAS